MQFSVDNAAEPSSGYIDSLRRNAGKQAVGAVKPVAYADSQVVSSPGPKKGSEQARKIEESFNRIASDHYGETVGYGPNARGYGYEASGRVFDMFV